MPYRRPQFEPTVIGPAFIESKLARKSPKPTVHAHIHTFTDHCLYRVNIFPVPDAASSLCVVHVGCAEN